MTQGLILQGPLLLPAALMRRALFADYRRQVTFESEVDLWAMIAQQAARGLFRAPSWLLSRME